MACGCKTDRIASPCSDGTLVAKVPRASGVIIFFKRSTTIIGKQAGVLYHSDPFDVSAFNWLKVVVSLCSVAGSGGLLEAWLEVGSDVDVWSPVGVPISPAVGQTQSCDYLDLPRNIRLAVRFTTVAVEDLATFHAIGIPRRS